METGRASSIGKKLVEKLLSPRRLCRAIGWRVRNRLMLAVLKVRNPGLVLGTGVRVSGRLKIQGPGSVIIGDRCEFAGEAGVPNVLMTCAPEATITIGPDCRFNGVHVIAQRSVRFGAHCLVADAHLFDTDFHPTDPLLRRQGIVPPAKPIVVGDNVWIGSRSAVLKGVTIGENSVVGYRTVVRRDVPPNCVVIGNPERIVKRLAHDLAAPLPATGIDAGQQGEDGVEPTCPDEAR